MKTYLSINVNGIGRITDKTPEDIAGIGTYNVKICIVIYLYNDERISLLHLDFLSRFETILEEIKYFDKPYKMAIVIKDESRLLEFASFLETHLPPELMTKLFRTNSGTTYLDRKGNFREEDNLPAGASVTYTPNALLRTAICFSNIFITNKPRNCVLEYDGEAFLPIDELCKTGQELLEEIRNELKKQNLIESYDNVKKYLTSIPLPYPFGKKASAVDKLAVSMTIALDHFVPSYINSPSLFSVNGLDVKISYDKLGESYARHLVDTLNPESYKHTIKPNPDIKQKLPYLNASSKTVVLPMFWLRQLPKHAIHELEENFGVKSLASISKK